MTLIYILIFLIFLEFSLRNYFEFFKDNDNSNNIKRIPNLSLKRNYIVDSLSSENKNSELDEKIGWRLIKNSEISIKVTAPYINENLNYKYKINELGARSSNFTGKKKTIGFFGCSITYGHGLNEQSTFANQTCEKINDYEYLNYGVAGYSLYQSFLKYKEVSKKINFEKIIFTVHKDLERRNTSSLSWLKMINRFWGVPGVIYFKGLRLKFRPRKYIRIFPSKFKILMFLEFLINFLIYSIGDNNLIKKETNEYLLNQIKKECIKNNSELIILCLDNLENLSKFLNKNDFNWNYSGINLDEENTKGEKKWLLMPWDNHPNNDANSIFADKILKVINSSKRPFNPKIEIIKKKSNPQEYIYPLY